MTQAPDGELEEAVRTACLVGGISSAAIFVVAPGSSQLELARREQLIALADAAARAIAVRKV